ncbi:MAG: aldehyde dehydrogenase family protein [Thioalkalivibrio sp.]|nr:aldehyde dehydrogenase family protein [Thioalkalivibrio sp.]
MTERFHSLTVGTRVPAGHLSVFAPFDGALIAEVETVDAAGVEQALETAYRLFRDRSSWLPLHQRIGILERTATILAERAEDLAVEAAREGGKPLIDSRVEVARSIDSIRLCVDYLRTDGGDSIPMGLDAASAGKQAFTVAEPIGVVIAVSAFNHPMNLIAHQVGPAVAAGCPVIVKPAEDTPLSCFRFVHILREAGLPDAWCQALLTTDLDVATKLVTDPRVGFFSFIGSAKVGWKLRSLLAPGTRCALEHGGAAPVIVADDADLDLVVPKLLKGGFYHAGQVCVSVQRVFAHRSIAEELGARLAEGADRLRIGDPTVSTEEIFGPVVCVYAYDDLETAVAQANALPWAFQAAVFSRDMATAMCACHALDASAVMINEHTAFRVDWMPFAGLRQSGLGVGGIPYTLRDMQTRKMIVFS